MTLFSFVIEVARMDEVRRCLPPLSPPGFLMQLEERSR
jgi:hypothetical protein